MWWTLFTLGMLLLLGLELALDRDTFRSRRAAGRFSGEMMRTLSSADQQEVRRAVRAGVPVSDPRLAPAAVTLSETVLPGRASALSRVNRVLWFAFFAIPATVGLVQHRWLAAAASSTMVVLILGLEWFGRGYAKGARAALTANQRLLERPGRPEAPATWG